MAPVPSWVQVVGFLVVCLFALSAFTGQVWVILLMMGACFVMVVVENRYANIPEKPDPLHFE